MICANLMFPEICRALIPTRVPGLDGIKVVHIAAGAEHSALVTGEP